MRYILNKKKKRGGTVFFKSRNLTKEKEGLWTCSIPNGSKKHQWQNTILDARLKRKNIVYRTSVGQLAKMSYEH